MLALDDALRPRAQAIAAAVLVALLVGQILDFASSVRDLAALQRALSGAACGGR